MAAVPPSDDAKGSLSIYELAETAKAGLIAKACRERDFDTLVQLVDSPGGLLTDTLRQDAWPILLGCNEDDVEANDQCWQDLPRHRDEDQVQLDVNRSFIYYPNAESEKATSDRKATLSDLIVQTLRRHPALCYFQGYHDIVQVLLLVLGQDKAKSALPRVSLLRIRDYMLPTLAPALSQLQLLPAIMRAADPELATHLSQTRPFFALSATLTLYAHDIQEYGDIARLFDFILAHEPVLTLYLFATIVILHRKRLLDVPADETDMLHFTLTKLLVDPLDLEDVVTRANTLFRQHPPEKLSGFVWWRLSSLSVLKTSRSIKVKQSLTQGEKLFRQQVRQLQREEILQKTLVFVSQRRGPILSVAAAVLFAGVSVWLGRKGNAYLIWSHLVKTTKLG